MTRIFRQGDCVLREVSQIPTGIHITKAEPTISVLGETGHPHMIRGNKIIETADGKSYVIVEDIGAITHAEHAPIMLPSGIFEIQRVRTYQVPVNTYSD